MSSVPVFFTDCRWEADSASLGSVRGDVYSARTAVGAGGVNKMLEDVRVDVLSANLLPLKILIVKLSLAKSLQFSVYIVVGQLKIQKLEF